jgi:hypothetical protein
MIRAVADIILAETGRRGRGTSIALVIRRLARGRGASADRADGSGALEIRDGDPLTCRESDVARVRWPLACPDPRDRLTQLQFTSMLSWKSPFAPLYPETRT